MVLPTEEAAIELPVSTPEIKDEPNDMTRDAQTTVPAVQSADEDITYPSGIRLFLVMLSIFTSMFLVSLDRLIVATAIPQITNQFHAAGDIGWYGTAYLLTNCAFQLLFGKLYSVFPIKPLFLVSIVLFEAGSAVCGAATNSIAFILGRAVAGLGAGGILAGVMAIMVHSVPLQKRPQYQGFFGAVFAVASVMGPLVGGAFTANVTWRWCFFLNLPIGSAVFLLDLFLLHIPGQASKSPGKPRLSLKEKLYKIDFLGMLAMVPGIVCLCLALQWGGSTYAWSNGRIVALLVIAFVLLVAFVAIQVTTPDKATVPPRILLQRSVASGFLSSCCTGAHMTIFSYYLPLWFQAIQGVSAIASGIRTLPMMLPVVVASVATGFMVSRIGYYTPFLLVGAVVAAAGSGLLTTLRADSPESHWVGYQLLYGFGLGFSSQAPNMAAQTVLPRPDVAIGASLMFFGQQLLAAVFTSVGQNVLATQLANRLAQVPGVSLSPKQIQSSGATELLNLVPTDSRSAALSAYNESLRLCFRVGLIMACIAVAGALTMEWRSVKRNGQARKTKASSQDTQ